MVGITTVSPQAVDESAPCLHVRSASATSQRGCRRCSAQGFFEAARTIQLAGTRPSCCNTTKVGAKTCVPFATRVSARVAPVFFLREV